MHRHPGRPTGSRAAGSSTWQHVAVVPTGEAALALAVNPWPVRAVALDGTLPGHRPPWWKIP
eukprot:12883349-Alexandrium_andersonii.AAC.1